MAGRSLHFPNFPLQPPALYESVSNGPDRKKNDDENQQLSPHRRKFAAMGKCESGVHEDCSEDPGRMSAPAAGHRLQRISEHQLVPKKQAM